MKGKWWARAAFALVMAAILYFWGRSLLANWQQIHSFRWDVRPGWLLVSLLLLLIQSALLPSAWWLILHRLNYSLPWYLAVNIWLRAQIARYLPGSVMDVAGRLYLGSQAGLRPEEGSVSVVLEIVMQITSAVLLFFAALLTWPSGDVAERMWPLALAVPLAAILIYPPFLEAVLNFGLRKIGREPVSVKISYARLLEILAVYLVNRLLIGLAFFAFAASVARIPAGRWLTFAGIFSGAWVAGYLVPIAPMGLGVREGTMTWLLGVFMPIPVATVIAVGFRVWISVRDMLSALAGVAMDRYAARRSE